MNGTGLILRYATLHVWSYNCTYITHNSFLRAASPEIVLMPSCPSGGIGEPLAAQ
jgi:hypothetical protein